MALPLFEGRPLVSKLAVIGLIVLALMIPLSMLRGLITERSQMRNEAIDTVAKGWGGSLTFGGAVLRVPFDVERKSSSGEVSMQTHQLYILADDLYIQAIVDHTRMRRVGIYAVPVYLTHVSLNGTFKMTDVLAAAAAGAYPAATYHWKEAWIRLPISDVRSIRELTGARLGERALIFGPAHSDSFSGVESKIDLSRFSQDDSVPFSAQMVLAGSQALTFLPTAATTHTKLDASWPDPQFQGAFLPSEYMIDKLGFHAQWQVLALNRAVPQSWIDAQVDTPKLTGGAYGAGFYQSVDVYQRSERAVKYALLFIALTFLSFFAWESLARVRIHPMQYLLIGLALSSFYLLLIALSEHLPFWLSYGLGAAALVALLGFYIAGAMHDARPGVVISGVMGLVYGLLYILVVSESYSLLIGALALFTVLATVMTATRKLQWGFREEFFVN